MADILVGPFDLDQVRELLGVDVGELPNLVIEGFAYLEAAELDVKRQVTDWSALLATADGAIRLKTAVAYLTAARLVTRQKNRQRSSDRIGPSTAGQINWDTLKADLERMAADVILALQPVADDDDDIPAISVFTVAGVSRRRRDCYRAGWCP